MMRAATRHLSSSPCLSFSSSSCSLPSSYLSPLLLRSPIPSCTRLATPAAYWVQHTRGATKKKPLSSLQLKIKVDVVEKSKHELTKNKKPEVLIANLEKPGVTDEEALAILKLAIANKIDTNDVYSTVLDIMFATRSELIYKVNDIMMPEIYTKKYSLMVLNQLISCLIQLQSEKVFPLLEEMLRVELKPNIKQFGLIVEIYSEKQKWDECFQFLDFMIANQVKPDSFTFSCMFKQFARSAPVEKVERLKERMHKEGVHVSKHVYWHMQETYARHGMREKVVEMYNAARREIVHPYISMITQYGKWGETDKAAEVLEVMKDDLHTTGLTPAAHTYNALTEAFCLNKEFERAYGLIDKIKKDKTKYNDDTWNIMFQYAVKYGDDQAILGTSARMKKLHGRMSKDMEKKVLQRMKEKEIDYNSEVNRIYWSIWPDFKLHK